MLSSLTFSLRGPGFIFLWVSLTTSLAMVIDVDADVRSTGLAIHGFSNFQMAKEAAVIAEAIYTSRGVPGWNLTHMNDDDKDHVGLYKRDSTCVVAFSGSNGLADWMDNFKLTTTHQCGFDFHKGFYESLVMTLAKPTWTDIANVLRGSTCEEVVLTGHSLGGAMASILAACANQNGGLEVSFPSFPAFTVDKLYTAGAPGISKQRIGNPYKIDNCFSGMRVVNRDEGSYDPVPWLLGLLGFHHPTLEVTRLMAQSTWWAPWRKRKVTKQSYSCTSREATPSWWHIPRRSLHDRKEYVQRMNELLR